MNILTFYNAIANNGVMVRPKFVKAAIKNGEIVKEYPTEIINPKICSERTLKQIQGNSLQGSTRRSGCPGRFQAICRFG